MSSDLELAKKALKEGSLSLVVAKDGQILATGERQGIADLLAILDEHGEALQGAALADRVAGRAAALVVRLSGIAAVYAQLASRAAVKEFSRDGILLEYGELVEHILNRDGSDLCPFEKLALAHEDPHQAVEAFRAFLKARQAQPASLAKKKS